MDTQNQINIQLWILVFKPFTSDLFSYCTCRFIWNIHSKFLIKHSNPISGELQLSKAWSTLVGVAAIYATTVCVCFCVSLAILCCMSSGFLNTLYANKNYTNQTQLVFVSLWEAQCENRHLAVQTQLPNMPVIVVHVWGLDVGSCLGYKHNSAFNVRFANIGDWNRPVSENSIKTPKPIKNSPMLTKLLS